MKINKEQADHILNQYHKYVFMADNNGDGDVRMVLPIDDLKKILNRCVNEPPENGYIITQHNNLRQMIIYNVSKEAVIVLKESGDYRCEFVMSADLLKQHIGHCEQMLNWLEEND